MATAINELLRELDETAGAVYWNADQPYAAINTAQIEVAARLEGYALATATLTMTSGVEFYPLPATILTPTHLLDATGKELVPCTEAALEDWTARWRTTPAGVPRQVVVWDAQTLRVYPKPSSALELRLVGVPWPAEITTALQSIPGEPSLQHAIVCFAAARLFTYTQPELAQAKRLQGEEYLMRFKKNARLAGSWNTLRIRPGNGWSLARASGDVGLGRRYY